MDITINDNEVTIKTERNSIRVNLAVTPEIKSAILAIYQAGRDREMINFLTNVESTVITQETN